MKSADQFIYMVGLDTKVLFDFEQFYCANQTNYVKNVEKNHYCMIFKKHSVFKNILLVLTK